jgi:hypothetical protein
MTCKIFKDKNGNPAGFICSKNKKQVCHVCGKPSISLCDATRNDGTPCDNPMCDEHRYTVGHDTDVCQFHNSPKFIEQAIKNRKEREKRESNIYKIAPEVEDYFIKQYAKSNVTVVPGHWPVMKTKEDVDRWISFIKKLSEIAQEDWD